MSNNESMLAGREDTTGLTKKKWEIWVRGLQLWIKLKKILVRALEISGTVGRTRVTQFGRGWGAKLSIASALDILMTRLGLRGEGI